MIKFSVSLVEFVLATFIPVYVGMVVITYLQTKFRISLRYLSAFALGLMFWFFFDTMNDAVQLDVNSGYDFATSTTHSWLLAVFVFGFLVIGLSSTYFLSRTKGKPVDILQIFITGIIVAIGMGFHGVGEGIEFGGLSAGTQATTILDAIGGIGGGVAYVIHKFLESSIVAITYLGISIDDDEAFRNKLSNIVVFGLAFGIPSVLGEIAGYFVQIDSSYFFALGVGAALAVSLLIVFSIFRTSQNRALAYSQWVWTMLAVFIGFLCLYGAALFHS
ncbi:MAG TPA: hypothetical protein VLV31_03865 [Candidatus Acidoferrales bacterium]|nr:hypothetical protein [Candidatus Acidoferrales bacterium]